MKLKKALSGVLAAAMVVTLAPTMAFASTTNTVASVPTVKGDATIPTDTVITLTVKDTTGWNENESQKIKLTLSNAKWDTNPNAASTNKITATKNSKVVDVLTVTTSNEATPTATTATAEFISATDNTLEFAFKPNKTLPKDGYVNLTINQGAVKTESTDGPVTVAIDGLDSKVTSSTVTVATVGTSTTTAVVNGDVKTYTRETTPLNTSIEIRETAVNSIEQNSEQKFELRLPKGVTWDVAKTNIAGDMFKNPSKELGTDPRILVVSGKVTGTDAVRNVVTITPAISIGRDASMGDIAVQLTGKSATLSGADTDAVADASDLLIAKYGEESVEVSTLDTVPEIVSGYTQNAKDKTFYVYATLKESMGGALSAGKYVDFTLPEEVQICGPIEVSNKKGDSGTFSKVVNSNTKKFIEVGEDSIANQDVGTATTNKKEVKAGQNSDMSTFAFTVPSAGDTVASSLTWKSTANTITFKIPVTVQADFTGDIKMNVAGSKAGLDAKDLVVATAKSPITVEAKATDVKNGVQKQTVSNITIKEVETGYLDDGTKLTLKFDDLGLTKALVFDDADIKVTAGDIELGKKEVKDGTIIIPIKSASTKASTIEISGISATLNRTLPEGKYDLLVAGDALIKNEAYNDTDFDVTPVKVEGYVNIVTPADTNTVKVNASFVIGKTSYTNNGTEVTMDAAPYIAKNRTMVPIRYIANACGVSDENITWNQATRTATISGPNNVVTIKMGSNTITTSNGVITMDTVAVNTGNRIYVPARFIANALGATVTWDAATQTVGITK